jgi:hypothetical protein
VRNIAVGGDPILQDRHFFKLFFYRKLYTATIGLHQGKKVLLYDTNTFG